MSLDGYVVGLTRASNPLGVGGMRARVGLRLESWRARTASGRRGEREPAVGREGARGRGDWIPQHIAGVGGGWDATRLNGWWGTIRRFTTRCRAHSPCPRAAGLRGRHHLHVPLPTGSSPRPSRRGGRRQGRVLAGGPRRAGVPGRRAGRRDGDQSAPTLGAGERLFEGLGDDLHGLELRRSVAAPAVTTCSSAAWRGFTDAMYPRTSAAGSA